MTDEPEGLGELLDAENVVDAVNALRGRFTLSTHDLLRALRDKQVRLVTDQSGEVVRDALKRFRRMVAEHEAAHAVVAVHVGLSFAQVELRDNDPDAGGLVGTPPPTDVASLGRQMRVGLAGREADKETQAPDFERRGSAELKKAKDMAAGVDVPEPNWDEVEAEVAAIVASRWLAIQAVATDLEKNGWLSDAEVRDIVGRSPRG